MISTETVKTPITALLFARKKLLFSIIVLVIFHAVGFYGLLFSGNATYFQNLTPLNLLLTALLLFLHHKNFRRPFWLFIIVTFSVSFLAEVMGVKTGLLFGNYWYGGALGFKLWQVPLLIGLNWIVLIYSAGILVNTWTKTPVNRAVTAALLMVLLDLFIEPAAMRFDFWQWQNHIVPLQNYVGWFTLAFLLQLFFQHSKAPEKNAMAGWVFGVQTAFFIALNIFL